MRPPYYLIAVAVVVSCLIVPDVAVFADNNAGLITVISNNWQAGTFAKFWKDLYEASPYTFGSLCTILTACLGVVLGLITDQLMKLIGIDLTDNDAAEH